MSGLRQVVDLLGRLDLWSQSEIALAGPGQPFNWKIADDCQIPDPINMALLMLAFAMTGCGPTEDVEYQGKGSAASIWRPYLNIALDGMAAVRGRGRRYYSLSAKPAKFH